MLGVGKSLARELNGFGENGIAGRRLEATVEPIGDLNKVCWTRGFGEELLEGLVEDKTGGP